MAAAPVTAADQRRADTAPLHRGRVVAGFGRRFAVELDRGTEIEAVRRGKRGDVVVGDLVGCRLAESRQSVIESIEPRESLLFRADAERSKPLAANVGQVAVVFAPQPPFSREFIWRALLAARAAGIDAMAVLNKTDLPDSGAEAVLAQLAALGARTARISARAEPAFARATLGARFEGRATLLVGQSGMGKSTLLNLLIGAGARTGEVSPRGQRGRQTTTASRWYRYGDSGAIVDTPGFHEFGLEHLAGSDLARLMPDLEARLGACRFADCRHFDEPGCPVREAVAAGTIASERYAFYRALADPKAR
jgi:ribosome biogenesis GTPase